MQPKKSASSFRFGATNYQIMGSFHARIPKPNGTHMNIKTNIFPINVPFLIGLDIFMEHCLQLDFETHQLKCRKEKWKITLQILSGHVCIKSWQEEICNFTRKELWKLHYHLMHPSSGKLFSLLKKAYPDQVNSDIRKAPDKISTAFEKCNEQ